MDKNNELRALVGEKEKVFYEGKPDKKCFIFECIFNPMLFIAIFWGLIDMLFLGAFTFASFQSGEMGMMLFIFFFMIIHMMPVWLYLGGVIFSVTRYKNTYYIVTDRAVYASSGIFHKNYNSKPFAELSHVDLHRGVFDQHFGVGDIILTSNQISTVSSSNNTPVTAGITLSSIANYTEVYNTIKKLQQDIYTDVMYPNDLRPKENHGYDTEYKG
ncbi:MAG: PH domain-containing protein [Bacilli bacterium]|nr:PH domain-containing protein [Bacilli bacterium]